MLFRVAHFVTLQAHTTAFGGYHCKSLEAVENLACRQNGLENDE